MTENTLKARLIHIFEHGKGGPVFLFGTFSGRSEDSKALFDQVVRQGSDEASGGECPPFVLAVFETENWNLELSPWPAEGMEKDHPFGGGGPDTLSWLESSAMPFLRENFGNVPVYTAGYSLAGLFALWSLYEGRGMFSGAVCCSGSLWFPGWMEKAESLRAPAGSRVYLSLGGKEEKTSNPTVKTIGDDTRRMAELLEADPGVAASRLEWNKGGHFADSSKRLAKGMLWMLGSRPGNVK